MAKDPLHGITLQKIVTELVDQYGWQQLGEQVKINCFLFDPSINSTLKFLRRVPWARTKVEDLYLWHLDQLEKERLEQEALQKEAFPDGMPDDDEDLVESSSNGPAASEPAPPTLS